MASRRSLSWVRAAGVASVVTAGLLAAHGRPAEPRRFHFTGRHMGTLFQVTLYAADERAAKAASDAAFRRAAELDGRLSDYKPDSELMRLCARAGQGPVHVGDDLLAVLEKSQDMARRSGGAFDVTVGQVVRLWRLARRTRELPAAEELAAARVLIGHDKLRLDGRNRTAELTKPGMRLDLGGIAKGFAAQEMVNLLRAGGHGRVLVAAGGDVVAGEPPPGAESWEVAIASLQPGATPPTLRLSNVAVSTAGDAEQFVEIGGVRYAHIVDPRTGVGLTEQFAVTVIANDGATADAASTAAAVLGPQRGLKLVAALPNCVARFVWKSGERFEVRQSLEFAKWLANR